MTQPLPSAFTQALGSIPLLQHGKLCGGEGFRKKREPMLQLAVGQQHGRML